MAEIEEKPKEVKVYSYNTAPGMIPDWVSALALMITVVVVVYVLFRI